MKKILSVVLMAAMVLSIAGCGGNGSGEDIDFDAIGEKIENMSDDELENAIEEGVGKLESMGETTTTAAQTEEAPKEESYEPLQEIIDADLSSGLVQIGDDIFKSGGYMTVNEFIAQYGDKYDMSEIKPDGYMEATQLFMEGATVSKKDSGIKIYVSYINKTTDMIKIGDAIVADVSASLSDDFSLSNTWYPGGINSKEFSYDELVKIMVADGFNEPSFDSKDGIGSSWLKDSKLGFYTVEMQTEINEINLLEKNPIINYYGSFYMENGKVTLFRISSVVATGKWY